MATKKLIINEIEYLVTMDPKRVTATISKIGWVDFGGTVTRAFEEITGKSYLSKIEYIVPDEDLPTILKSATRKFSKRKQWQNLYDLILGCRHK